MGMRLIQWFAEKVWPSVEFAAEMTLAEVFVISAAAFGTALVILRVVEFFETLIYDLI